MKTTAPRRGDRGDVVGCHVQPSAAPIVPAPVRRAVSLADEAALIARGKALAESGNYLPARGEYLGTIECWGLDVYEGSPQEWIDALWAEARDGSQ